MNGNGKDDLEREIGDMLKPREFVKDINPHHIPQVSNLPKSVETTAKNIESHFLTTAQMLEATAERLEVHAHNLRDRAARLCRDIGMAEELREAVRFEMESRAEVQALALVDAPNRLQE